MSYTIKSIPIGTIIAWSPGYFTSSNNGGAYVGVLATDNTTSDQYLKRAGYKICDGQFYQDPESPIFFAAGRAIPNLTDSRFMSGHNSLGGKGGFDQHSPATHTMFSSFSITMSGFSASWNRSALSSDQLSHSHSNGTLRGTIDATIGQTSLRVDNVALTSSWTATNNWDIGGSWDQTTTSNFSGHADVTGISGGVDDVVFPSLTVNTTETQPSFNSNLFNSTFNSWNNKPTYLGVMFAMRVK